MLRPRIKIDRVLHAKPLQKIMPSPPEILSAKIRFKVPLIKEEMGSCYKMITREEYKEEEQSRIFALLRGEGNCGQIISQLASGVTLPGANGALTAQHWCHHACLL